jgi:hypothetical protein
MVLLQRKDDLMVFGNLYAFTDHQIENSFKVYAPKCLDKGVKREIRDFGGEIFFYHPFKAVLPSPTLVSDCQ